MKKMTTLFLTFLLLTGILISSSSAAEPAQKRQTAPDFTLTSLDGKKITLSAFKGKVVILDFWATWCPPYRAEIPGFVEIYNKYNSSGLVIIGVALDTPEKVRAFVKSNKITYPVVIGNNDLANLYGGIQGMPTTFVIDKNGKVLTTHVGYVDKAVFVKEFNENK